MSPHERERLLAAVAASAETFGDERFREGVRRGLAAAEFVMTAWKTGRGATAAKQQEWAQGIIDRTRREAGL